MKICELCPALCVGQCAEFEVLSAVPCARPKSNDFEQSLLQQRLPSKSFRRRTSKRCVLKDTLRTAQRGILKAGEAAEAEAGAEALSENTGSKKICWERFKIWKILLKKIKEWIVNDCHI